MIEKLSKIHEHNSTLIENSVGDAKLDVFSTGVLSELFYTIDSYNTFAPEEYLSDLQYEDPSFMGKEIDFDSDYYVELLAKKHSELIDEVMIAYYLGWANYSSSHSPYYYNYTTDKADVKYDVRMEILLDYIDGNTDFDDFLKERFTDGDGFLSFMPNNREEFLEEMDDARKGILLGFYLTDTGILSREDYIDAMYEDWHEMIHESIKGVVPERK